MSAPHAVLRQREIEKEVKDLGGDAPINALSEALSCVRGLVVLYNDKMRELPGPTKVRATASPRTTFAHAVTCSEELTHHPHHPHHSHHPHPILPTFTCPKNHPTLLPLPLSPSLSLSLLSTGNQKGL